MSIIYGIQTKKTNIIFRYNDFKEVWFLKLSIEELHYISIIVDSIVDTEGLVNDDILNRGEVNNFVRLC